MNANRIRGQLALFAGPGTAWAIVLAAIAVLATTASCSVPAEVGEGPAKTVPAKEHAAAEHKQPPAVPTAQDYKRIARLFGESLVAGNYPAAYQLTSSRLQSHLPLDKFTEICSAAVKQYGEAMQLGPVIVERADGLAGQAASQQFEFPSEIPDADRLAWLHSAMALDMDGEDIIRCYDCWMLLENDGGHARIGHFRFTWCD